MTDVEQHVPQSQALVLSQDAGEMETFVHDLQMAYEAAARLVTTSFVPATYQGKAQEAAAAIMTGHEVGLSPLASLRSIDIISGTPAMRAITLRALVQNAGHEIWTVESTATQAIVRGRRRGSENVEQSVWTMDRAQRLNLTNKSNWKTQPIAMLLARATSELVRLIAADVILGLPYSAEEIQDSAPVDETTTAVEEKPARRTTKAKRAPLPAEQEPDLPNEPVEAEPVPVVVGYDEPVEDWATAEIPIDDPKESEA